MIRVELHGLDGHKTADLPRCSATWENSRPPTKPVGVQRPMTRHGTYFSSPIKLAPWLRLIALAFSLSPASALAGERLPSDAVGGYYPTPEQQKQTVFVVDLHASPRICDEVISRVVMLSPKAAFNAVLFSSAAGQETGITLYDRALVPSDFKNKDAFLTWLRSSNANPGRLARQSVATDYTPPAWIQALQAAYELKPEAIIVLTGRLEIGSQSTEENTRPDVNIHNVAEHLRQLAQRFPETSRPTLQFTLYVSTDKPEVEALTRLIQPLGGTVKIDTNGGPLHVPLHTQK